MIHNLFSLLCFQFRVVDVEYFMDKLQPYEVNMIVKNLNQLDRSLWESTRLIIYYNTMMWSKDKMELKDFMTFAWEKENNEIIPDSTEISNDDIKRLKEKSKEISQMIKLNSEDNGKISN